MTTAGAYRAALGLVAAIGAAALAVWAVLSIAASF